MHDSEIAGLQAAAPAELWCWRHPKAHGAAGRCIGRTEVRVDPRRARRLARRIRALARQHGLPRTAWVSPRSRCRDVGQALRQLGFKVQVDARLAEMDFGLWDGRRWEDIPAEEIGAWADKLLDHAPGGGESLRALAARARDFAGSDGEGHGDPAQPPAGATPHWQTLPPPPDGPVPDRRTRLVVGHGGWINALAHVKPAQAQLPARQWPAPPPHGALVRLRRAAAC